MIIVTGGAGFIGGNFVLDWIAGREEPLVNLDKLTYAGNLETLASVREHPRHHFVQGDIGDRALLESLLAEHRPRAVLNFAAESHVDRSIHGPGEFIQTNIVGTYHLLEAVRGYWSGLAAAEQQAFQIGVSEIVQPRRAAPQGLGSVRQVDIEGGGSGAALTVEIERWGKAEGRADRSPEAAGSREALTGCRGAGAAAAGVDVVCRNRSSNSGLG